MTWNRLQKPCIGLHWWYRLLTGRKYTYPVIEQDGYNIWWKYLIEPLVVNGKRTNVKINCRFLNIICLIKFIFNDLKKLDFRYIKERVKEIIKMSTKVNKIEYL